MPSFHIEPYAPDLHQARSFRSGVSAVDTWLRSAKRALQAKTSAVFVLIDLDEPGPRRRVLGYFALAASSCEVNELPGDSAEGLPAFPVPCFLITWLGLDRTLQGQGLGDALLGKAVAKCLHAREHVAAVLVVVDSLGDEATAWYQRRGFRAFARTPRRLFARMEDLAERSPAPGASSPPA
ncbi:MAG: GNAT family N-acetyltransferase [Planctomycetota bacterium]|jgi:ribosomal protein S18 acetylase RimI-like enzyme|nr:GNAT family N-acetyltransferase [Planctomycetota bacterium]